MSRISPTGASAQRARTRIPVLIASADATSTACSKRGVGAVEPDQRERERPVQRLALHRLGLPRPRHHLARVGDVDELGERGGGQRVVLDGRDVHPPVRAAIADDAAHRQARHEAAQHRAERTGVVETQFEGCRQRLDHGHRCSETRSRSRINSTWNHCNFPLVEK